MRDFLPEAESVVMMLLRVECGILAQAAMQPDDAGLARQAKVLIPGHRRQVYAGLRAVGDAKEHLPELFAEARSGPPTDESLILVVDHLVEFFVRNGHLQAIAKSILSDMNQNPPHDNSIFHNGRRTLAERKQSAGELLDRAIVAGGKPNLSSISRKTGVDRKTLAKMFTNSLASK